MTGPRRPLTAAQAGRILGVSGQQVINIARARDLGFQLEGTNQWLFTKADVAKMRKRNPPGRPRRS